MTPQERARHVAAISRAAGLLDALLHAHPSLWATPMYSAMAAANLREVERLVASEALLLKPKE